MLADVPHEIWTNYIPNESPLVVWQICTNILGGIYHLHLQCRLVNHVDKTGTCYRNGTTAVSKPMGTNSHLHHGSLNFAPLTSSHALLTLLFYMLHFISWVLPFFSTTTQNTFQNHWFQHDCWLSGFLFFLS
jgi:hypothetical protein